MTARSFSIPTTLPLTTVPSCKLPWPNASSSIAAKSSLVGTVDRGFGPPGRPRQVSAAAWNAADITKWHETHKGDQDQGEGSENIDSPCGGTIPRRSPVNQNVLSSVGEPAASKAGEVSMKAH